MMKKRNWTGLWIEPQQEAAYREPDLTFEQMVEAEHSGVPSESHLKPAKHLRRLFTLENSDGELPVEAKVYASAHGVYELYINGKKADSRILAPETTNYEKVIWYQVYDVTELISESTRAAVDILLGDGWWIGRLGMAGSSCNYGDKLGFIMDLELTYPDGRKTVIGSDEQFLSCDSFIQYSDLYIGEGQDWTLEDPEGENRPVWTNCEVKKKESRELLAEQPLPGIQVVKELPCQGYVETPKGDLVADFGQVTAGVVRLWVNVPSGTCITVEHAEVLDSEGNYYSNIKGLYKDQKDRYICRSGEQVLCPHFTYHGFRYIRIQGISKEDILELTALAYGTPNEKIAHFETDHALINGLQRAIENSTVSNMISVPTDCPQREKLGWTGDINIFTGTGAFLYDLRDFLSSWLLQVRLDQFENGEIPVVVPNHPCQEKMQRGMSGGTNSSAAWSDCIVFMPLRLYEIYGDLKVLTDNFDAMEKWMSYASGQTRNHLWIGRFHFGDWLIPSLREEPDGVMRGVMATADIVGSCYYAMALKAMIQICKILDQSGDHRYPYQEKADQYEALYAEAKRAICEAYVYENGKVGVHAADARGKSAAESAEMESKDPQLQGLYVVLLHSGAVQDPELKAKMLARLVQLIQEAGDTLDCGFASIGFLLDVLYDNGYREIAYRLLFNTSAPSWLYMIKHGATTIWENWRAIKEDGTVTDSSYNHYAYGCVGDFMYRHMGGMEALEPGYRRVRIAPDFDCGIHRCSCSRKLPVTSDSHCGKEETPEILVQWELEEGSACSGHLHVEIPTGVSAEIILPDGDTAVESGIYDYQFSISKPGSERLR